MNDQQKKDIAKQLEIARMSVMEYALLAFVEDLLGRVPSDDEIIRLGRHVQLADTPIATFEAAGKRFQKFFVWDDREVVAVGFLDPKKLLELYIVRVKEDDWPFALKANIEAHKQTGESSG